MSLISLVGASKSFGHSTLFNNLTLHIGPKERLGLIGPNGSGKSTLLNILAGIETIDTGERRCLSKLKLNLVSQTNNFDPDLTIIEVVLNESGQDRDALLKLDNLIKESELYPNDKSRLVEIDRLSHMTNHDNTWLLEQKCEEILQKLGINDFHRRVGDLSGGLNKRLALAASLVAEPEILLLDEPTNHLDSKTIEWLEHWLHKFSGAVIMVTHDRYVLERVTNRILEINQGEVHTYTGNYEAYLEQKSAQIEAKAATSTKLKGIMRRELAWLRQGAKARSTKQKARINRIEIMKQEATPQNQKALDITVAKRRLGKTAIEALNLGITYDGTINSSILLRDFSYTFKPEDRIGIIGPNGSGKSTFLDLVAGRRPIIRGTLKIGPTVQVAYFDQYTENLLNRSQANIKAIDFIQESASQIEISGTILTTSQFLERFSFSPDRQHTLIKDLSGGEKRRLYLCRLLIESPNILLLDEPTNDLDIQTLSILEDLLADFAGCVIVVSHDRYFLDRVIDRIFFFNQTHLESFEGNYSDFINYQEVSKVKIFERQDTSNTHSFSRNKSTEKIQSSFKAKQELKALDLELPNWEKRRYDIEVLLTMKEQYRILEILTEELSLLTKQISHAEDRWLTLSEPVPATKLTTNSP
uniref:ATPase n=1 Tax=Paulinella longichromatophora TaxID=1708747 RepID=A0A2H4ZQ51_9EUKA|nr:ATPase [Paulinella longichromatophora]